MILAADGKPKPHDLINFNLRPNKRVERKLILEALNCIYRYDSPRRFGYVGMGSYYFSDFVLFHSALGIDEMVSIEDDTANADRFKFNKPFRCIKMAFGSTHQELAKLKIFDQKPVICWLDYYCRLNQEILGDLETVVTRSELGSAIIVTLNSSGFRSAEEANGFFKNLPPEADTEANRKKVLSISGLREFLLEQIEMHISALIADLSNSRTKFSAERILNISYKDGTSMVTFGWLLLDDARKKKMRQRPFASDAPAIRHSRRSLDISTPTLTFREIAYLKSILPSAGGIRKFKKRARPVKPEAANQFAKFYRHFPNFADIAE